MINPEDPTIVDLRSSFTRDEIVAKLLGWLQGPIFPKFIQVTLEDSTESELVHLSELDVSLEGHLTQLKDAARRDLLQYVEFGVTDEAYLAKKEEINRIDQLTIKALNYAIDIDHEISLGVASTLLIDQNATANSDCIYYTLKSADEWTTKNYGISIRNYSDTDLEKYEPEIEVERDGDKGGLNKAKANNLYLTLAFLIDAFLEADPNYAERIEELKKSKGIWNKDDEAKTERVVKHSVTSLGKYLSIRSLREGSKKSTASQSGEAIKTRIEDAQAYQKKVLAAFDAKAKPRR